MKETMSRLLDSMKAIPPLSLEESDSGVSTVKKFMDSHKEDSKKQIDDYDMDVKEIIKGVDQDFSEDEEKSLDANSSVTVPLRYVMSSEERRETSPFSA